MTDEQQQQQPDLSEFAALGAKIAEVGTKLNQLRAQRTELDREIVELEGELTPLIVRHSELIAVLTGRPLGATPPGKPPVPERAALVETAEPDPDMPPSAAPVIAMRRVKGSDQQKERIREFLSKCEPGTSSHEIADALKIDSALVRAVMRETVDEAKRKKAQMTVEPE